MGELDKHIAFIEFLNEDEVRRLMPRGEWPDRTEEDAPENRVDPSFYGPAYGNPFHPTDPSYYEYNRAMMDLRAPRNPAYPSDFGAPVKLICNYCGTRNVSDLDRCKACGAPLVLVERQRPGICLTESHEEIGDLPAGDTPIPSLDEATESFEDKLVRLFFILSAAIVIAMVLIGLFSR